jgi:hypothetical protein
VASSDGTSSSLLLLSTMSTTSGFGFGGPATTATPFLFSCSAVLVGCAGWAWPPDICGRRTLRALEAVAGWQGFDRVAAAFDDPR